MDRGKPLRDRLVKRRMLITSVVAHEMIMTERQPRKLESQDSTPYKYPVYPSINRVCDTICLPHSFFINVPSDYENEIFEGHFSWPPYPPRCALLSPHQPVSCAS